MSEATKEGMPFQVRPKRFWWFHRLFRTSTYKSCRLMELFMAQQSIHAMIYKNVLEMTKVHVLYDQDPTN